MMNNYRIILAGFAGAFVVVGGLFFLFGKDDPSGNGKETVELRAEEPVSGVETAPGERVPAFDIVRVETDGSAVVAGRSMPGATVELLRDGKPVAKTKADEGGEWVITPDKPFSPGDFYLTLSARNPDGSTTVSMQSVAISITKDNARPAMAVLMDPDEASRILQGPGIPSNMGNLVLRVVDYDENGNVILSGFADAGARVQAWLNDTMIGSALSGESRAWEIRPEEKITPGTYTLRIEQLASDGRVDARIEVPFEREAPDAVEAYLKDGKVVIQPGHNLWNIARDLYGTGFRYTVIYQANQDQIRDPDLIYPGQIFEAPPMPRDP